jgi:hypothetical protein
MGPTFQENLGTKFDICSIFKPNAPLANVEGVGKLDKDFIILSLWEGLRTAWM